jgi:dCTP deaminase
VYNFGLAAAVGFHNVWPHMSTNTYPWNEWIPGSLNDSQLAELIDAGIIENAVGCAPDFSSFDLTLDDGAYEMVQGSVKPQGGGYEQFLRTEGKYARRLKFDSDQTVVLNPQKTYVFKLREMLSTKLNVSNIHGQATAKSSVGRVDVLARLIVDGMHNYEGFDPTTWRRGNGSMFLEVTPITFHVRVKVGKSLSQLRLFQGKPEHSEVRGKELYEAVLVREPESHADEFLRVDVTNLQFEGRPAATFRAKRENTEPINLWVEKDKDGRPVNRPDPEAYWVPEGSQGDRLRITERNFYIIRSKEKIKLPRGICVYCRAIDETIGEMRIHYAGFVHPYFGYPTETEQAPGTSLIFEVCGHDVDVVLNDNEPLARLQFYRMSQDCAFPPDQKKLSPYSGQTLKLSQFFDDFPIAN